MQLSNKIIYSEKKSSLLFIHVKMFNELNRWELTTKQIIITKRSEQFGQTLLVSTIFNEGAYLTFKSIFHKALTVF